MAAQRLAGSHVQGKDRSILALALLSPLGSQNATISMSAVCHWRMQVHLPRRVRRHGIWPVRPLADAFLLGLQQRLDLGNGIFLADVLDRRIENALLACCLSLGCRLGSGCRFRHWCLQCRLRDGHLFRDRFLCDHRLRSNLPRGRLARGALRSRLFRCNFFHGDLLRGSLLDGCLACRLPGRNLLRGDLLCRDLLCRGLFGRRLRYCLPGCSLPWCCLLR